MKRNSSNFKEQSGSECDHSQNEHRTELDDISGFPSFDETENVTHLLTNLSQVSRTCKSVKQRHAIKQDSRRESSQQEILHRSFVRFLFSLGKCNQHVEREGHQLQTYVERDQVIAAGEEQHTDGREKDECIILSVLFAFDIQIAC